MIRFVILLSTSLGNYVYCQTIWHSAIARHRDPRNPPWQIAGPPAPASIIDNEKDEKT
jgi:hypothetical protein